MKSRIKNHSTRNPCECCAPAHDGTCRERAGNSCGCAFHRLETLRVVYKVQLFLTMHALRLLHISAV